MREQGSRTVREQLLPFDEIQSSNRERVADQELHNFYSVLQKERQRVQLEKRARLASLYQINDPCFAEIPSTYHTFYRFLQSIDERYPVLVPESPFMLCWNFLLLAAILFNLFEIPMALFLTERVYEAELNSSGGLAVNIIFFLILFFDTFLVQFNVSFYKNGKEITSRISIFQRKIKLRFWIDTITTLVLFIYIVSNNPNFVYLKFVFYLKIYTLLKIDQEILDWLDIYAKSFAIFRLFRVIILLWFITTWVASIYFAMDYGFYQDRGYYYNTGQLWLTNSGIVNNINMIENFPWYVWYQYAVYWSLQTSSTVGYGNVTPKNPVEVLYCNIIILFNTLLFAYFINSIWEVIGDLDQASNRYAQNWGNLKNILKQTKIPSQTKHHISEYLHQIWLHEDKENLEQSVNTLLSEELRDQLSLSSRKRVLEKIPIFIQIWEESENMNQFATKLFYKLENMNVPDEQIVYSHGDSDIGLFYIRRGKVEISIQNPELGKEVHMHSNFGTEQFITQQNRFTTAKTLSFCQLWKLSLEDFSALLHEYSQIRQKYAQLREQILFYNKIQLSNVECLKCKNFSHLTRKCSVLNEWRKKIRNPQLVILRSYMNEKPLFRQKYQRTRIKSTKVLGKVLKKEFKVDQAKKWNNYRLGFNI